MCLTSAPLAVPPADGTQAPLHLELYREGDWEACQSECARQLTQTPGTPELILLQALSRSRMGLDADATLLQLASATNLPPAIMAPAAFELGMIRLRKNQHEQAYPLILQAFTLTPERTTFLQAGCALAHIIDNHGIPAGQPDPSLQLLASRRYWTPAIRAAVRVTPRRRPWRAAITAAPNAMIRFYQKQISPAIGQRCSLHPSCSTYAIEAMRLHGLAGLPMYANRAIREPDIVSRQQNPIRINGQRRYQDPLDTHPPPLQPRKAP